MDGELKKIKKLYGEDFAKLCRTLFSRILDDEGKLLEILLSKFAPSRTLYDELIRQDRVFEFKGMIYKAAGIAKPEKKDTEKTPEQLLAEAGYRLYRCKTDRDVKSFKRFYHHDELLCTFRDPHRIKNCEIFFVVREDVDQIKREDFSHPQREDRYGTSVMSLQFYREDGELSIKNRYNHSVENPDATYCNDLDSIIPGLTDSFAKYYGLDSRVDYSRYPDLHLAHYVQDEKGVAHRFNVLINGIFFCENNIVINQDGIAVQYDKGRYELVGTFLIDKSSKTLTDLSGRKDSFANLFKDVEKIETEKADGEHRNIIVTKTDGTYFTITVDKTNAMVHYENKFQTEVEDGFLQNNTSLQSVNIPNARKIGKNFLCINMKIKSVSFPELEEVGDAFLKQSSNLQVIYAPSLKRVGEYFLYNSTEIKSVDFPSLEEASHVFMAYASKLEFINAPNLRRLGESAFRQCVHLKSIDLPALEEVDKMFLRENQQIEHVHFPALREIGDEFMFANRKMRAITLPSAETIGNKFIPYNEVMASVKLPVVKKIGNKFLNENLALREIYLPEVKTIGSSFLYSNKRLKYFDAPQLEHLDAFAFYNNKAMTNISLPKAEYLGEWTLHKNKRIKTLDFPRMRSIGSCFLTERGKLKKIRISNRAVLPANVTAKTIEHLGFNGLEPEN